MASDILANYAAAFNEADIGDCVYYDFESAIPQITPEMFGSMKDVQTLNTITVGSVLFIFQSGGIAIHIPRAIRILPTALRIRDTEFSCHFVTHHCNTDKVFRQFGFSLVYYFDKS